MASKLRLQICHHNRLFRECLASALAGDDAMDVLTTGWPESGSSEVPGPEDRELLLLDAGLPGGAAFRLVEAVRAAGRSLRIILMVPSTAPEIVDSCRGAGADGCIDDGVTLDELRGAIEVVLSGQSYCSDRVRRRLLARPDGIAQTAAALVNGRPPDLTTREDEILRMIAFRNMSNKQIARELSLSIFTVKNHVHSILEKTGAEDRQAAARHMRSTAAY